MSALLAAENGYSNEYGVLELAVLLEANLSFYLVKVINMLDRYE
jgi:hypothetical protein